MRLSSDSCRIVYETLIQLSPIKGWRLPPSEKVIFQVIRDPKCYGEYENEPHVIRISSCKVGHLDTLVKTMAHEIVHLKLCKDGFRDWDKHGREFKDHAGKICTEFGFDPKEF